MTPQLVILDLDGTVHRDGMPTFGAVDALCEIQRRGTQIRFLSNNSTIDPRLKALELAAFGIRCEPEWIATPCATAARVLREGQARNVFVVGEHALRTAIEAAGMTVATEENAVRGEADAVVLGLMRDATFQTLRAASRAVCEGATFVATNADKSFPVEQGRQDPGAGALLAFVEAASGRRALVIGKPSPTMVYEAMAAAGVGADRTIMVGDRLDTDIAAGLAAGTRTWLVLTGVEHQIPPGQAGSEDLGGLLSLWD